MSKIQLLSRLRLPSPFLSLQAAGSLGNDYTPRGIYTRWELEDELGENHLPKGNLTSEQEYEATYGYNRENDFVRLYRTPYIPYPGTTLEVDLLDPNVIPQVLRRGNVMQWRFQLQLAGPGSNPTHVIYLYFLNRSEYKVAEASVGGNIFASGTTRQNFFDQYQDELVFWLDRPDRAFSIKLNVQAQDNGSLLMEGVNREPYPSLEAGIAFRKSKDYPTAITDTIELLGEHIGGLRWKAENARVNSAHFVLYEPYFHAVNEAEKWKSLGAFALSLDNEEVFERLENPERFLVDKRWPHYNDGARVRVDNYKDKWTTSQGLKSGVIEYLELSTDSTNPTGLKSYPLDGGEELVTLDGEDPEAANALEISSLDMLRTVAQDFHVARMLGLGYIDTDLAEEELDYALCMSVAGHRAHIGHRNEYYDAKSIEVWFKPDLDEQFTAPPVNFSDLYYASQVLISKMSTYNPVNGTPAGLIVQCTKWYDQTVDKVRYSVFVQLGNSYQTLESEYETQDDPEWMFVSISATGPASWRIILNDQDAIFLPGAPSGSFYGGINNYDPIYLGGLRNDIYQNNNKDYLGCIGQIRIYDRSLSEQEQRDQYLLGRCTQTVDTTGLVGWWKLDEAQGYLAADSSTIQNPANLVNYNYQLTELGGGAWVGSPCGDISDNENKYSLCFSADDQRVSIPANAAYEDNLQTFEIWIKPEMRQGITSSPSSITIREQGDVAFALVTSFQYFAVELRLAVRVIKWVDLLADEVVYSLAFDAGSVGNQGTEVRFPSFLDPKWLFISVTKAFNPSTGEGWRFQISDQLTQFVGPVGSGTAQLNDLAYLALGGWPQGVSDYGYSREYRGCLSHARIYNRSLSSQEQLDHFSYGRCAESIDPEGLVGWWKLDEEEGTVAADSSPIENDGALQQFSPALTALGGGAWAPTLCAPDNLIGSEGNRYIYSVVYTSGADPGSTFFGFPANLETSHVQLSLPTSMEDERLPYSPSLEPVDYGLFILNADDSQTELTDPQGYSWETDQRFIRLSQAEDPKIQLFEYEARGNRINVLSELAGAEFDMSEASIPLRVGLEYRLLGESEWRKPELLFDDEYNSQKIVELDEFNEPEIIEIPESLLFPSQPVEEFYTHVETESGVHEYALYGVNIFQRVSPVGQLAQTDLTDFPLRNTLLPPANFAVQYIQKEKPLVLTSQAEQDELLARINQPLDEPELTRVTFLWNHVHQSAYRRADKIDFFFRLDPPDSVRGTIKEVVDNGEGDITLLTGFYRNYSTNPSSDVIPEISVGEEGKYLGGVLSTNESQEVFSVLQLNSGTEPQIQIKAVEQTATDDPSSNRTFLGRKEYSFPGADECFLMVENLLEPSNWPQKLAYTVDLIDLSNHEEVFEDENGNQETRFIGGIFEPAQVDPITETVFEPDSQGLLQEVQVFRGLYHIAYASGTSLADHPQTGVSWYQGTARISFSSTGQYDPNQTKELSVVTIVSQNPLEIYAVDANYDSDPIQTGVDVSVNFHPGYRLYLEAEPQQLPGLFQRVQILPGEGELSRVSLMAARSRDSINNISSDLSPASLLVAKKIVDPIPPDPPIGPLYATRPDRYGKSSYTFDIKVNEPERPPYGFVFYRTSQEALLNSLFETETAEDVKGNLIALEDQSVLSNYWSGLANLDVQGSGDTTPGAFKSYGANSYFIPPPDKSPTFSGELLTDDILPQNDPGFGTSAISKAFVAISNAFTPLTTQPVLFEFLEQGRQTSPELPKVVDSRGQLLPIESSEFNPFPMARRYAESGEVFVRFTDYKLDGAMHSQLYFYRAREIASDGQTSNPSAVSAPVKLLHALPPPPPKLKTLEVIGPRSSGAQALPRVAFQLSSYLPEENVTSIRMYRATTEAEARTVRTMKLATTVSVDSVADVFSDLEGKFPPYAETLFYRLVALRFIVNENEEPEVVPSIPSEIIRTRIVDDAPPPAPPISYDGGDPNATPDPILPTLSWPSTCKSGTYYLYKMTEAGQWALVNQVSSNEETIEYELGDFLPATNGSSDTIYHRFKVDVVNSGGIQNDYEEPLII